jgi:hypothetical protein
MVGSKTLKPIQVRDIKNNLYVVKRGEGYSGKENKEKCRVYNNCNANTINEFFSLFSYFLLGVPVPDAALYEITCSQSEETHFVILTKWLDGITPSQVTQHLESAFCPFVFADVMLQNFDVAGPKFRNLVVSNKICYRVDCGGCLFFGASGKPRKMEKVTTVLNDMLLTSEESADICRSELVSCSLNNNWKQNLIPLDELEQRANQHDFHTLQGIWEKILVQITSKLQDV